MFQHTDEGRIPTWSFADRLRKAREFAGLDQGDLAPLILKKRSTLSGWERGNHRPDELTIRAIAFHTGVSFDWLWSGTDGGNHTDPSAPQGYPPHEWVTELLVAA